MYGRCADHFTCHRGIGCQYQLLYWRNGDQYGVASTKSNLLICTGGFVQVTGTFQQYGMNVVLNAYAVLLVTGSWNAYASTPFYVNIGAGALVEDCGALTLDVNNFFTETSSSTSYVFIRGSIT